MDSGKKLHFEENLVCHESSQVRDCSDHKGCRAQRRSCGNDQYDSPQVFVQIRSRILHKHHAAAREAVALFLELGRIYVFRESCERKLDIQENHAWLHHVWSYVFYYFHAHNNHMILICLKSNFVCRPLPYCRTHI